MPADALHGGDDNNLNVIRLTECPPASTTCEKSRPDEDDGIQR